MLSRLFDIAIRLPRWTHPALLGAFAVAAIVSVRLILVLPALLTDGAVVREALLTVMAGAVGGAAGGLAYSLVGRPLLAVPKAGPYLTGIVTVAGYLGALGILIPYVDPDAPRFLGSPAGFLGYVFFSLLFGTVLGRSWFTGPGSLAEDIPIRRDRKQSPAEYRRARMEQRRSDRDTEAQR